MATHCSFDPSLEGSKLGVASSGILRYHQENDTSLKLLTKDTTVQSPEGCRSRQVSDKVGGQCLSFLFFFSGSRSRAPAFMNRLFCAVVQDARLAGHSVSPTLSRLLYALDFIYYNTRNSLAHRRQYARPHAQDAEP